LTIFAAVIFRLSLRFFTCCVKRSPRQCLFQASFGGRGNSLPKPALPSNGCQIVCSKSFFGQDNELLIYHGNFLLMNNSSSVNNRKDANLCQKCTKIHLAAREERGREGSGKECPKVKLSKMNTASTLTICRQSQTATQTP